MRINSSKRKIILSILLIISAGLISACQSPAEQEVPPITKTQVALDTVCTITAYDCSEETLDQCFKKIEGIEQKMSVDLEESEVSQINQNAGIRPVVVSDDTFQVISEAIKYSELTSGRFDITVGPLVKLWGINKPEQKVPSEEEIQEAITKINYTMVDLNDEQKQIFLKEKGMSLDLGGIAKGYAGDAIVDILKKSGAEHGIVDLGGNLSVIGTKPDGTDWNIGIQTPFQATGEYFGVVSVSDRSVVTSGIYQRYFKENGKIYHHIMDTRTGYPVDNGLAGVTIIYGKSIAADALAKSFAMGLEKGMEFVKNQKDAEAIFVTVDNEVYITPGLEGFFKITDETYKLMDERHED